MIWENMTAEQRAIAQTKLAERFVKENLPYIEQHVLGTDKDKVLDIERVTHDILQWIKADEFSIMASYKDEEELLHSSFVREDFFKKLEHGGSAKYELVLFVHRSDHKPHPENKKKIEQYLRAAANFTQNNTQVKYEQSGISILHSNKHPEIKRNKVVVSPDKFMKDINEFLEPDEYIFSPTLGITIEKGRK